MRKPITTLFMLQSLDGKITFDSEGILDYDADIPKLKYTCKGLHQYYEIEETTDYWTMCTGKTLAKIGWNKEVVTRVPDVSIVVIDNRNLTRQGLWNLATGYSRVILITTNQFHEGRFVAEGHNVTVVYQEKLDLVALFKTLSYTYGCEALTVQTGSEMNGYLFENKLIDKINIVIAPMIVGGKNVPGLVGGNSIKGVDGLEDIAQLELTGFQILQDSYIHLKYDVHYHPIKHIGG